MNYLGDFPTGAMVYVPFHTFNAAGGSVTLSGLAVTDIEIYKDGSATQRASDAGYTLLDTDGIDFDGITGIHGFSINLGDNTDTGFFAAGHEYMVVVASVTVDSQTVNFVAAEFSIERAGGVLALIKAGNLSANVTQISGDSAAADNLETMLDGTGGNVLSLKQLNIVATGNDSAIVATGAGTGDGIKATGGATGHGLEAIGGATSGNGMYVRSQAGTGEGSYAARFVGGGSSDSGGIVAMANSDGDGLEVKAAGSARHGLYCVGAGTGEGLHATGGSGNSGDGAHFEAGSGATNGVGLRLTGVGTGQSHGLYVARGATAGDDIFLANSDAPTLIVGGVAGNVTGSVGSVASGGITAASIATNAIDADAIAADAVTEIQAGLATAAALAVVDDFVDTEVAAILAAVDTEVAAIKAKTDNLPTDPADQSAVEAAITAATSPLATAASIAALNNLSAAQVNAEVVDALNVDTYAEPGQGAPPATASLVAKVGYMYKGWRNKKTQTGTTRSLYNDAGDTVDQKATDTDDSTTFTKGEIGSGP